MTPTKEELVTHADYLASLPVGLGGWMEKLRDSKKISKLEWIVALESGEFEQFHGGLSDEYESRTCCVGVAGKVCGVPLHHTDPGVSKISKFSFWPVNTRTVALMVEGMSPSDVGDAISMNDDKKWTFQQIAAYFRTKWNLPA